MLCHAKARQFSLGDFASWRESLYLARTVQLSLTAVNTNFNELVPTCSSDIIPFYPFGEVSELADEHDLGSCAARRAGSSPAFPTDGVAPATPFYCYHERWLLEPSLLFKLRQR
jgi:hypothetical protein